MARLTIFFLLAALWRATPIFADTGFLDRQVSLKGRTYRFQVFVPADFTPATRWPVLVDLHGNGAQGEDGIRQTAHMLGEQIRMSRGHFRFITVFPQAVSGSNWLDPVMQEMVLAETDRTISEFKGDEARVYLSGFSMGATGAYRIAARWPKRFAALIAIAGVVEFVRMPGRDGLDSKVFSSLAKQLESIPTWIFHGEFDKEIPPAQSRQLYVELKKLGAPVTFTEYAATTHGPAAEKAYAEDKLWTWLLAQHRDRR